jgi:hypothetical protein
MTTSAGAGSAFQAASMGAPASIFNAAAGYPPAFAANASTAAASRNFSSLYSSSVYPKCL